MVRDMFETSLAFVKNLRHTRELEEKEAQQNPFLAQALEREKHEGHRLAVFARTVALLVILVVVAVTTPVPESLFYLGSVILLIALGWLQLRASSVGQSGRELLLIVADYTLLVFVFLVPNPFSDETIPTAFHYRFDNFVYFFVFLAVSTLAYSWRTVWSIGFWIAGFWLFALGIVAVFGHTLPGITEASNELYAGNDLFQWALDPNGLQASERVEEAIVIVMVGCILALKGARSNRLLLEQAGIAAERANLSRYFPSSLVDKLASSEHDIGAVRNQDVAVLFTDIVGFTKFAERNSADEVMGLLREYHSLVETAVFQNGGTLDKYLGDGAMATFGTPEAGPDDAQNALAAAQDILKQAEALNTQRNAQGREAINVSVGLHYGSVMLGDIGSSRRLEFTVIGDTVNVASRLEAISRELECKCVVSDELMKRVGSQLPKGEEQIGNFAPRQGIQLRGRQTPIDVWTA